MKKGQSIEKAKIEGGLEAISRLRRLIDLVEGELLDKSLKLIPPLTPYNEKLECPEE